MRVLFTFIGAAGISGPSSPSPAPRRPLATPSAGSGGRYEEITAAAFTAFRTSESQPAPVDEPEQRLEPVDLAREEQVLRDAFAGRGARRHAKAIREIALEWKPDVIVRDEI